MSNISYSTIITRQNASFNEHNNYVKNVLYYLHTKNLEQLKKLVSSVNVNKKLDSDNNTVLHYAVMIDNNDEIITYLLNCGSDVNAKLVNGKDIFDIAQNKKLIHNQIIKSNIKKIEKYERDIEQLKMDNSVLVSDVEYYKKTNQEYSNENDRLNNKIINLKSQINTLQTENERLTERATEAETAFRNLLNKHKK